MKTFVVATWYCQGDYFRIGMMDMKQEILKKVLVQRDQ
jgi:hypothetical protein